MQGNCSRGQPEDGGGRTVTLLGMQVQCSHGHPEDGGGRIVTLPGMQGRSGARRSEGFLLFRLPAGSWALLDLVRSGAELAWYAENFIFFKVGNLKLSGMEHETF